MGCRIKNVVKCNVSGFSRNSVAFLGIFLDHLRPITSENHPCFKLLLISVYQRSIAAFSDGTLCIFNFLQIEIFCCFDLQLVAKGLFPKASKPMFPVIFFYVNLVIYLFFLFFNMFCTMFRSHRDEVSNIQVVRSVFHYILIFILVFCVVVHTSVQFFY